MLNFDYLKEIPDLAPLHQLCDLCETRQYTDPDSSAINARKALEWLVKAIYKMKGIDISGGYDARTGRTRRGASPLELTTADVFADFIADPELMLGLNISQYVRCQNPITYVNC